ncbi:Gfo/Idh/MocA family protein [Chryseobacterium arthrosphaerae]|uniref:Gfo/Idh/MocA family protein n=1 Tax=Chryseobacterium arthrosphaerae TaxID=651561 RepID=UPI001F4A9D6E|nr:Gfo/Idh/MocA family oxidoreductase [Chryseobacterium arthrosphaerae]MDG4652697.1 Gfo/Idh/MocA family oxidoreductase [Chryseobacterium arthrosphaerae]
MEQEVKEEIFRLLELDAAEELRDWLVQHHIDIDNRYENERSLLHTACYLKKRKVSEMLIKNGADINAGNMNGTTPFMYAKTNLDEKNFDFLDFLIEKGADIEQLDKFGKSVIDYIAEKNNISLLKYMKNKQNIMNEKIKFAVVGCGHIGKRHAEMIVRNPECELVALIDVKDKSVLGIEDYNVPFFATLDAFLESGIEADIINIASPNGFHFEQAHKVINSGKHVVVEKPMTLAKNDAEKLIFQALHKHKQVFAVMQNRYSPPSVWIKEMIESGRLGKIFMVQLNCYWNRDERYYKPESWHGKQDLDGGTLFTQFSHFIDIMYWLFGDITNIKAKFADFNHENLTDFEDSGFVSFDFVNGGMGSLNYSTSVWNQNLESSMTIIAENGSVKIGGQYMDKVEICNVKDYEMPELAPTNPGNDYGAYKGSAANHHYIIENVVDVLKGRNAITTNALEGMKVVDIIERIYQLK